MFLKVAGVEVMNEEKIKELVKEPQFNAETLLSNALELKALTLQLGVLKKELSDVQEEYSLREAELITQSNDVGDFDDRPKFRNAQQREAFVINEIAKTGLLNRLRLAKDKVVDCECRIKALDYVFYACQSVLSWQRSNYQTGGSL